jgi:hypothetical protein
MSRSEEDKLYRIAYRAAQRKAGRLPDEDLIGFVGWHAYRFTGESPPSYDAAIDARTDELIRRGMCVEILDWWRKRQVRT